MYLDPSKATTTTRTSDVAFFNVAFREDTILYPTRASNSTANLTSSEIQMMGVLSDCLLENITLSM
jgi:hypothetical protein